MLQKRLWKTWPHVLLPITPLNIKFTGRDVNLVRHLEPSFLPFEPNTWNFENLPLWDQNGGYLKMWLIDVFSLLPWQQNSKNSLRSTNMTSHVFVLETLWGWIELYTSKSITHINAYKSWSYYKRFWVEMVRSHSKQDKINKGYLH